MTKSNTTVDFAAYGLCQSCAELIAENIRETLMVTTEPHINAMVFMLDTSSTIAIKIEGKRDVLLKMGLHLVDEIRS